VNKVSIVICALNNINFAHDCLSNLQDIRDAEFPDLRVIVLDQDSQDGTPELIENEFPWVELIRGENIGISKSYNKGYVMTDSEYVLFLGMDAFPDKGTVSGMVEYMDSHTKAGAATSQLVLNSGKVDMDAHRSLPSPWIAFTRFTGLSSIFPKSPLFNKYFLAGRDMTKDHEVELCISHFLIVRRKVLDELHGFDEDFFVFGEDVDFCYRLKRAGWKLMYVPQYSTRHTKGAVIGIRDTTRKLVKRPLKFRLKMRKLSTDAMEMFLRKHYFGKYPTIVVYLMIYSTRLLWLLRTAIEYLKR